MKRTKPDITNKNFKNRTARSVFLCALTFIFLSRLELFGSPRLCNIKNIFLRFELVDSVPFNALSRFGFRNLFSAQGYSPEIPYSQQVNPNTELFMHDYLIKHKKNLEHLKKSAGNYFSLIETILADHGLPAELKYLAVIESNLKKEATSWVGAAGPWQFMPETAKEYGLIVNNQRDDRRDYHLSTAAAAQLLKDLFSRFKDWLLVIAAYNGGPGAVNRAIIKSGSTNFWTLQHHLPKESRDHVKKFIATHYMMENENVGSLNSPNHRAGLTNEVINSSTLIAIKGSYLAKEIAEGVGLDPSDFNRFNPQFDHKLAEMGFYPLRLPHEKMRIFLERKQEILKKSVRSWMQVEN
jgi:membrane-bound lytic murein transglycosylase D